MSEDCGDGDESVGEHGGSLGRWVHESGADSVGDLIGR